MQDINIIQQTTTASAHAVYDTAVPKLLLRPADSLMYPQPDTTDYLLLCNDSVFAPYADDTVVAYRESLFSFTTHSTPECEPLMRNNAQTLDWMFFVIVGLLALISVYINHIRFNMKDIFLSLFNLRAQGRVERENNVKIRNLVPMTGIYLASLAALVYQIATSQMNVRLTVSPPLFYAALTAGFILYVLLRGALIRLIGNIFGDNSSVLLYLTSNHLFYFVGGMVLTPLLLFVFFAGNSSETTLYIAAIFAALLLVVRFIRGIQLILTNSKTSKLYLFYYLCILEIVPILAMAKILIR